MMSLNNFLTKPEYTVDNFLADLYIDKKFSEEDELLFLTMLSKMASNYDLKVSACEINSNQVINYFMKEKSF